MNIKKLFVKLIEHDNELKRLAASEVNAKKKEKVKEVKWDIFLKALSSKTKKEEDDIDSYDNDSSKEEETWVVF